jgi:hypothetical protein
MLELDPSAPRDIPELRNGVMGQSNMLRDSWLRWPSELCTIFQASEYREAEKRENFRKHSSAYQ